MEIKDYILKVKIENEEIVNMDVYRFFDLIVLKGPWIIDKSSGGPITLSKRVRLQELELMTRNKG